MRSVILASLTLFTAVIPSSAQAGAGFPTAVVAISEANRAALERYDNVVGRSDSCLHDINTGGMSCFKNGRFVGYLSASDIAAANRAMNVLRKKN